MFLFNKISKCNNSKFIEVGFAFFQTQKTTPMTNTQTRTAVHTHRETESGNLFRRKRSQRVEIK